MTARMKENKYLCVKKKMWKRRKQALTACIGEPGTDSSLYLGAFLSLKAP